MVQASRPSGASLQAMATSNACWRWSSLGGGAGPSAFAQSGLKAVVGVLVAGAADGVTTGAQDVGDVVVRVALIGQEQRVGAPDDAR